MRRILRHPSAALELILGDLQVVLRRDQMGVTQSLADEVNGKLLSQLGFASAAQVLDELGPRFETGPLDDL